MIIISIIIIIIIIIISLSKWLLFLGSSYLQLDWWNENMLMSDEKLWMMKN